MKKVLLVLATGNTFFLYSHGYMFIILCLLANTKGNANERNDHHVSIRLPIIRSIHENFALRCAAIPS